MVHPGGVCFGWCGCPSFPTLVQRCSNSLSKITEAMCRTTVAGMAACTFERAGLAYTANCGCHLANGQIAFPGFRFHIGGNYLRRCSKTLPAKSRVCALDLGLSSAFAAVDAISGDVRFAVPDCASALPANDLCTALAFGLLRTCEAWVATLGEVRPDLAMGTPKDACST